MDRILVVDDEPQIVQGLTTLLALNGFDVVGAFDRQSAEALIAGEFFAIVLADARLITEQDGQSLLESIRRISPRSRVASLTGDLTAALEQQLAALGAALVLQKPVDGDVIVSVLRELLREIERSEDSEGSNLEELYQTSRRRLFFMAQKRYGFTHDDADELVQQAWCLFLEKKDSIRAPRAWLTGTLANLCKQEIRRRYNRREDIDALDDSYADEGSVETTLAVHEAISLLDERGRNLCQLIAIEHRSYDEVSNMLALPVGSVGPLYMRAKAKLRQALAA